MVEKILIIDDDEDLTQMLLGRLLYRGYDVYAANSGLDGLKLAYQYHPNLVILDLMMPEMDGWETFRQLRDRSSAPVVFLTALNSGEVAAQALTIGANDFVRKPFHPGELLARSRHHNAVTLVLPAAQAERARAKLKSMNQVASVEQTARADGLVELTAFPNPGAMPIEDVSAIAVAEKWDVRELYAEAGRLDDVFRELTMAG